MTTMSNTIERSVLSRHNQRQEARVRNWSAWQDEMWRLIDDERRN